MSFVTVMSCAPAVSGGVAAAMSDLTIDVANSRWIKPCELTRRRVGGAGSHVVCNRDVLRARGLRRRDGGYVAVVRDVKATAGRRARCRDVGGPKEDICRRQEVTARDDDR